MPSSVVFALLAAYSTGVGALYLFGFWGSFQINFLEHASVADILRLSVYPLVVSGAFFVAGWAQAQVTTYGLLPTGGGRDTSIGRFGRKYWKVLVLLCIISAYLLTIISRSPYIWNVVSFFIASACIPVGHHPRAEQLIPHPSLRFLLFFLAPFLAVQAFGYGKLNAYNAKTGSGFLLVDNARSKLGLVVTTDHPAVLLGRLGDRFFVYETDTSRIAVFSNESFGAVYFYERAKSP